MTDQPARYRRTPADIEAVQWTGTNTDALRAFAGSDFDTIDPDDRIEDPDQDAQLLVEASHWVGIKPGDWVVKYEGYFVAKADATFRAVWESAAVSVPPSTDQTALRDRIAAVMREHYLCTNREALRESDVEPVYRERAAAVLAVLPAPADGPSRVAAEEQAIPCAECGHPRTVHQEGDDPVTPGECSACPDDDARHDHRRAVGEQPGLLPRRGDTVDTWLKTQRNEHRDDDGGQWSTLDQLLDLYRLHADTGTPLGQHVCEGRTVGDCDCMELHLTPSGNVRVDHLLRKPAVPATGQPPADTGEEPRS